MTPSLGSINLLEQLTELQETHYLLDNDLLVVLLGFYGVSLPNYD